MQMIFYKKLIDSINNSPSFNRTNKVNFSITNKFNDKFVFKFNNKFNNLNNKKNLFNTGLLEKKNLKVNEMKSNNKK